MAEKQFQRDNHYVPESYLRRWSPDGLKIWTYRILLSHEKVKPWKFQSIEKTAYYSYLYAQTRSDGASDDFERWLCDSFESPAAPVIEKACRNERMSEQEWHALIRFVAAQSIRTPKALVKYLDRFSKHMPAILESSLQDVVKRAKGRKITENATLSEEDNNLARLPIQIKIEDTPDSSGEKVVVAKTIGGRSWWLHSMKGLLLNEAEVLHKHKWTVLQAPPGILFLTSDDPVIKLNYIRAGNYHFDGGWGSKNTEIFMPLDPKHLLYTKIEGKSPRRGSVISEFDALRIQRLIIEHAHRHVFSCSKDPYVAQIRPHTVDPVMFNNEHQQWNEWHRFQTESDKRLMGY